MVMRVLGVSSLTRDLGRWRDDDDGRRKSARPAYQALAEAIRLLIHDGRVPLGVALPSERDLATGLSLSRTTITSTYSVLREDGYLISRQGSRSTVALPSGAARSGNMIHIRTDVDAPVVEMSSAALPAPPEMEGAYGAALQALPAYLTSHGMEPIGLAVLREAIADRYRQRGLPTEPDQIMVTLGAQHALSLLLAALIGPGDRVLIEHPTYPNAIEAIRHSGARPVPVPIRPEEGWDLDGIRTAARQTAARLAYMIPDFHNPTGLCMSDEGRAELARIARETRMTVIVDESMAELNLDIEQRTPVAAFARGAEVITIGSASKSFWGGLRVGWIRARPSLITRVAGTRSAVDLGTPVMDQLATADLLGSASTILAARHDLLRRQRSALLDELELQLPEWRPMPGPGGMSLWIQLPTPVSTALAATAPNFGVLLAAGPRFGVEGAFERFVRLPYTHNEVTLRAAVSGVAAAYGALSPRSDEATAALVCV
ncbi:PLP-dependent aminotransferase family protein [Antrihabitans sp. YC2-6]|uniref:MocR-like transcription factor YczR n=1 Tax=Antrihabitans sp. YC2-6 TaxID=2799498 RepID=UPI0018F48F65|nr:PLP-dependent aminotransferase family protein [Antrihabitans sp. YC2-6]MBJ8348539.1 PLP-dependent aminotransferase family protein [Antrihabitans sp. YC2-6]